MKNKTITCAKCGNELTNEAKFCTKCGTKVEKPQSESESVFCSGCGKELDHNSRFCNGCGRAIESETTPTEPPLQVQSSGSENTDTIELSRQEMIIMSFFAQTSGGLFSNKPSPKTRLSHFAILYRMRTGIDERVRDGEAMPMSDEEIASEIAIGIEGLVQRGLAEESKKGVKLTPEGFAIIAQD